MNEPTMTHLTFQDGVTPLQAFHLVMIPASEAESIERKGLPQRDSSGNPSFHLPMRMPTSTPPSPSEGTDRHPFDDELLTFMISVYRVIPDVNHFQYVLYDDEWEASLRMDFGNEIGAAWEPPASAYIANPKKPAPDFWGCFSFQSGFGMRLPITQDIVTFLDQSCEGLPFMTEDGEEFIYFNVTYVANALDKKRSRHKPDLPGWIEPYAFHPRRCDFSLFKIPQTGMAEVLCVEGLASPHDEFKGRIEELGLKGFKFQKLWSDAD